VLKMQSSSFGFGVALCAILLFTNVQALANTSSPCTSSPTLPSEDVLIVGGQNGTWFHAGQYPRLFKLPMSRPKSTRLRTFESQGTIWSGSTNGTVWMISGWGNDRYGANPPIVFYGPSFSIVYTSSAPNSNSSWYGGDIFASSYSNNQWLLSGMGSGHLDGIYGNHMTLATFNGSSFKDYSSLIPDNQIGILYTNDSNGSLWMIGGGFGFNGVLFTFDGSRIHDLNRQIAKSVPTFGPVTSLAWNGSSWLVGGHQFVALYDGHRFIDMTGEVLNAVGAFYSVNAINWDREDATWLLTGGYPRADVRTSKAWIASLSSHSKTTNLSPLISCYLRSATSSSILSSTFDKGLWALGGYAKYGAKISPILLVVSLRTSSVTNFSYAVSDMTYVIWVKFGLPDDSAYTRLECGLRSDCVKSRLPLAHEGHIKNFQCHVRIELG